MTMVRTNLDNTRERARQLRFEPTGTISATSVQKAIEEVASEAAVNPPAPTVVTASPYAATTTDVFIYVNFAGAVTINLPAAAAWLAANPNGLPLTIKDISGAA